MAMWAFRRLNSASMLAAVLVLCTKSGSGEHGTQIDLAAPYQGFQEVPALEDTDDMVDIAVIDRDTGKTLLQPPPDG